MPRQNTFTVVPNALGMQGLISRDDAPATKPQAMTSKQAKKRYKEATKAPKLSKAEQRRIELEEQERIRKELDKQKSANKARIAREKKKAKELADIQARKKKGLPLVDVHPSQDTISRFIRKGVVNTAPKRDPSGNVKGKAVEEQSRTVSPERDDSNKENIPDCREEAVESPRKRSRLDKGSPPKTTSENILQVDDNIGGGLSDKATFQQKSQETLPTIINKEVMPGPERRTESTSQRHSQPRQSWNPGSQSNGRTSTSMTSTKDSIQTPEEVVMMALPKPIRLQPDRHLEDMGLARPRADTEVSHQKQHEVPPPKPGPARKAVKPLPTGMRPRPALGETDGNRSTPPKLSKETVPARSYQKPELASQETQQQIPRENSQPKPKVSMPKESVVYSAVETSRSLPSPQPHVCPMPPPSRPPMSACQPSHAARLNSPVPQYPTTATANPSKPSSTAAHTNKFASPYEPMGPPAFAPQRPSPGPPRFKQPTAGPSSGSIQKSKFLPKNHLQPTASRAPFLSNTGKPSAAQNIDTPPSSTQLFVMSHLDDLLPSPSQELRELEEDVQPSPISRPPVLTTKQGQVPAVAPKSPFALGSRRFARQTSHVQIAPPQPRMQEVKPVEDDIFPFLSTQDLLFSSQDMRELDNDTPCKANSRKESFQPPSLKPSPKTASSSPSKITNNGHRPSGTASTKPAPKAVSGPVSAKQPEGIHATSNPGPRSSATSTPKASPAFGNQQGEVPNPSLPTGSAATHSAPKRTPPPQSPSPQRFFGSSGVGIQILLAMAESEKTFREEEERRQEKARREKLAEERRKRAAEQQAKRAAEAKRKRAAEERAKVMERLRRQAEEIAQLRIPSARRADSPMAAPEQRPATQAKRLPGQSIKQLIPSISKVKRPPSGWVPAQRPGMVKPVVEANHPQQPLPRPPLPESNIQGQHQPGQAPQVTKPSSPPKPKSSIPGQHQIQQVLKVTPAASSQETDYGDEDLDGLGLGELGGMGLTQFLGPDKDLSWLDDDDDDF
ncbi:hypothetical protein QBC45DRAFT_425672 [Copromyces sp. CBS 386.78]|nr:hypothetical protein QBC45DRAFT_425672 [Copromyces sp. CBS 386.78]